MLFQLTGVLFRGHRHLLQAVVVSGHCGESNKTSVAGWGGFWLDLGCE